MHTRIFSFLFCLFLITINGFALNSSQNSQKKPLDSLQLITNLQQELKKAKSTGTSKELVQVNLQLAAYYLNKNDYEKALTYNLKALELGKLNEDFDAIIQVDRNVAFIKSQVGNIEGALEIYLKNLAVLKKKKIDTHQDEIWLLHTLISITQAYLDLNDYEKAKFYGNEILLKAKTYKNKEAAIIATYSLGGVYSETERYELALETLEKASQLAGTSKKNTAYHFINFYRGKVFFYQKKYEEAFKKFKKIIDAKGDMKFSYLMQQELYSIIAKTYLEEKDHEKSTHYFDKALSVFNKIDALRINLNTTLINQYDENAVKEEIDELFVLSKKRKQQLYLLIAFAVLVSIGFFLFYRRNKKKNQKKFDVLIEQLNAQETNKKKEKISKAKKPAKKLEGKKIEELLLKLDAFENDEGYLDKEITLLTLAKKLETNTNYLSKLINQEKELPFTKYLTELRLNYVLTRLKNDKRFRSYTIQGIAEDIGYTNAEPFAKAFKKKTGIYPSYFIKKLESDGPKKASA